jgi:biotin carboxylase
VGRTPGIERSVDRALALGLRVVAAVPDGSGTEVPPPAATEVADTADPAAVAAIASRHGADGILAASPETLLPAAAAARALALPGLPEAAVQALANRIALRRELGLAGVPQPRFAAVRTVHEGHVGLSAVGLPAVLKPSQPRPGATAHVLASADDLEARLYLALAASANEEAIVESFHRGASVEIVSLLRGGTVDVVAVFDRPESDPGTRAYPSTLFGDTIRAGEETARHALHALALGDAVATVQLVVADEGPVVAGVAAWTPDDSTDALARHAVGVDLLEAAIRIALGVDVPDGLARPRFHRPAALRLIADGEEVPDGAEHGRGYVVVEAATNLAALEQVSAAQ